MKKLYSLHSKWSLLAALPRLWFLESELRKNFPALWDHKLELPRKDYITFFPYIISVKGRKKIVKDPINIVAYGVGANGFIHLLQRTNSKWRQFLGSSYFLYNSSDYSWHSSITIKLDIDEPSRERHHIRLFEIKTARGKRVTLGAAHHDWPHHTEKEPPFSWNEIRDLVASDISTSGPFALCGLSEQVTEKNWRGSHGDGKILIIKMK